MIYDLHSLNYEYMGVEFHPSIPQRESKWETWDKEHVYLNLHWDCGSNGQYVREVCLVQFVIFFCLTYSHTFKG